MFKTKKGFTLIEIVVVIAVLAILVTIGVPRYLGHTKEANFTKLKHDARIVQDASDRYYIDNNDWPYLLDENGNKLIVSNPDKLTIIYKVEEYNESDLGTDPENDIVLYEIDFDKLKPYIRKLDSDTAYFVAARGNPEFGITALDSKSESNKNRINIPVIIDEPEEVGEAIREPGEGEIVIETAEDLAKIGTDENYPLNGNYIQMSDIDLSGYENWAPIGSFTGKFDGNGFKIRNLYINRPDTAYQGLFGRTNGATLTNISLENVDVTGGNRTGGLVGYADNSSTISNSYATGSVTGTGNNTGGLVGYANTSSTISNSYATGSVTGTGNNTGGLVGLAKNSSKISNSYATGSVTGVNYTGGLVGWANNSTKISNSYATGSVSGGDRTGGLVGEAYYRNTISNSYATGSVTGGLYVGGLVGWAWNSTITNSYSTGAVSGASSVGGLVGEMYNSNGDYSRVEYSYALNLGLPLIGSRYYGSGGSSNRNKITGSNLLSETEMKQRNSYSDNWNFDNIWKIDEGQSYPYLRDNPQSPPPGTN